MLTPDKYFKLLPTTVDMSIKTELYYVNEFTFTIAVILSAQATDKKVNEITPKLFSVASTPEEILKLGIIKLKEYIKVLSFFNNKAKNIIKLSEQIIKIGYLPQKKEELIKLAGIGSKTANVITNVLWNHPNIGVDTHVFRLSHRFNWVDKKDNTPDKVESKLLKIIPKKYHKIVNHVMVLHGRYVCKAINPKCKDCIVCKFCNSKDKKL